MAKLNTSLTVVLRPAWWLFVATPLAAFLGGLLGAALLK